MSHPHRTHDLAHTHGTLMKEEHDIYDTPVVSVGPSSPSSSSSHSSAASPTSSTSAAIAVAVAGPIATSAGEADAVGAIALTPADPSGAAAPLPLAATGAGAVGDSAFPVFRNQVAGHTPLLWHRGTVCKPLNPTEYCFYSQLIQGELSSLVPFAPKFYGILDMSLIPVEFQKQQAEKGKRKAEKRLVLQERERRDLEAAAAAAAAGTAATAPSEAAAAPAAGGTVTSARSIPSLAASSHSLPASLSASDLTAVLTPDLPHVASATSPPPPRASTSPSLSAARDAHASSQQMNTWVLMCQNRKKSGTVDPDPQRSASLPASFDLASAAEQHQERAARQKHLQHYASSNLSAVIDGDSPDSAAAAAAPSSASASAPPSSSSSSSSAAAASSLPQYIVLEDLTFAYDRPCILDLKLGTRQHGINDSAKKVASKISKCAKTTSGKIGIRLCGMQVYHPARKTTMSAIEESPTANDADAEEGDAPSAPLHADDSSPCVPSDADGKFIYYDKYYGRSLTEETFLKTLKLFFWNGEKLLLHIILLFLERLDKLKKVLEQRQMMPYRFYSSSLLMVYEGQTGHVCGGDRDAAGGPSAAAAAAVRSASASPRPDHYPALSSLASSGRLHDIVDRSLGIAGSNGASSGLPRSHSIDFHQVLQPQSLAQAAAAPAPPRTQDTLAITAAIRNSHRQHSASTPSPSTTTTTTSAASAISQLPPSPASASSASSSGPATHLDAEDLLELEQILAREVERIALIRRAYQPIVSQKIAEEKVEEQKRAAMRVSSAPTTRSTVAPAAPPSATDASFQTPPRPVSASQPTTIVTPSIDPVAPSTASTGAFSPSRHISYVHVDGSGATVSATGPHFGSSTADTAEAARLAAHASPQPPSPLPIPAVSEDAAGTRNNSETPVVTIGQYVSPPPPAHSPAPAAAVVAPKFYNRARKTTHAQARERARLKGNIDIRLIDYAQVVKWDGGEERALVDATSRHADGAAHLPRTPPAGVDPTVGNGVGDPGLLIGVNNLIYFISNIVQQEIQQMLHAEKLRTDGASASASAGASATSTPSADGAKSTSPLRMQTPPLDESATRNSERDAPSRVDSPILAPIAATTHTVAFTSSHVPRERQTQRT